MLFNSYTFLVFFAVVLCAHRLPLPWRLKKGNLLLASYLFYAAWNPPFVVLLWISTLVDWHVTRALTRTDSVPRRRALLGVSLARKSHQEEPSDRRIASYWGCETFRTQGAERSDGDRVYQEPDQHSGPRAPDNHRRL